jgi:hypothetical protein
MLQLTVGVEAVKLFMFLLYCTDWHTDMMGCNNLCIILGRYGITKCENSCLKAFVWFPVHCVEWQRFQKMVLYLNCLVFFCSYSSLFFLRRSSYVADHGWVPTGRPSSSNEGAVTYIYLQDYNLLGCDAMLSGSLVTTTWHILRLQMEERASRYGG